MLSSSVSSDEIHQNALPYQFSTKRFMTFWDMDDTCVSTFNNEIKNSHLLLPILLFQTWAPNQHLGILTNRRPSDSEGGYLVSQFLKDLTEFGIQIPAEHVIYGGGENNRKSQEEYHALEMAEQTLMTQLGNIKNSHASSLLMQGFENIKDSFIEASPSFDHPDMNLSPITFMLRQIERANFHGKNYHIHRFLNEHLEEHDAEFVLEGSRCKRELLNWGIVDDISCITDESICASWGSQFFAVKATDGGRPPKSAKELLAYHDDSYLIQLAEHIQFQDYVESLVTEPFRHTNDPAILQIAGYLYAWHQQRHQPLAEIVLCLTQLSTEQLHGIASLVDYLIANPNEHESSHYCDIEPVQGIICHQLDVRFLDEVSKRWSDVQDRIASAQLSLEMEGLAIEEDHSDSESEHNSHKKMSSLLAGFRKFRFNQVQLAEESVPSEPLRADGLNSLEKEAQGLLEKVWRLTRYEDETIAQKADKIYKDLSRNNTKRKGICLGASRIGNSCSSSSISSRDSFHSDDSVQTSIPTDALENEKKPKSNVSLFKQ